MKPIIIAGGVAAGMSAASSLKREIPEAEVIVYTKEDYISYGACGMPYYISGEIEYSDSLIVLTPEQAEKSRKVNVKTGHEVVGIDPESKQVSVKKRGVENEWQVEYEKLVIATGASSIIPNLENINLEGVFSLKEYQSGIEIRSFIENKNPKNAVIIGGGYIGAEMAESLGKRGINVTLVEALPQVLTLLDSDMSKLVQSELEANDVTVYTGKKVTAIKGSKKAEGAILDDGTSVPADMVMVSIGVKPNTEIAEKAGIQLGDRRAIVTDRYQRTSYPDIFAAGDCAASYHTLLKQMVYIPLALPANRQGKLCAENITAEIKQKEFSPFPGVLGTAMTKVFNIEIGKTGIGDADIQKYQLSNIDSVKIQSMDKAGYYPGSSRMWVKLYFDKQTGIIVGAQIVGRNNTVLRLNTLVAAITAQMTVQQVYNMDTGYAPPFSPVWDPVLIAARKATKRLT